MEQKHNAFVVYPTYKIKQVGQKEKAFVYLFGRLENGDSFVAINEYRPYFFIKTKDINQAENIIDIIKKKEELSYDINIEKTNLQDFDNNIMSKIILTIPKDVPKLRKELELNKIKCYEADVRFEYRFMMDHGIKGTMTINGKESEKNEFDKEEVYNVEHVFINPKIHGADYTPKLNILSFDIETDRFAKKLYSIALYWFDKLKKQVDKENLIINKRKVKGAVSFNNEKTLLEYFKKRLKEIDPDIITGWNVIDFDLKVLKEMFKRNNIEFQLGRVNWDNRLSISKDFMQTSKATIPGRIALDGIEMVKSSFIRLTDYKLNTAAQEILKDEKLITDTKNKGVIIDDLFENKPEELVKYNQKDAKLVIDILEEKKLIELYVKKSILTGMPLDRVNASVATLDSLYLRAAREKDLVCSSVSSSEKDTKGKGGYVMEPKAGIYDNVLVLDFKSLYPSIIITFNIDPMSYISKVPKKIDYQKYIQAPNNALFRNEESILGNLIQSLWKQRDIVKKNKDDVASYAIKIIMNSFYGALGNPGCRFFNINISNAITYFGQYIIQNTAKEIRKKGYDVIYSDTDSVFVDTKTKEIRHAHEIGIELEKFINDFYTKWVEDNYNRESALEIEFEKTYRKIIFPRQRGSEQKGAKKRYAGILVKEGKEKMDFTGLEFVRRDWTELAKKLQLELLDRIFHEKPVIDYVKQFLKDIKEGKYDDLMIYIKALRKDLGEYTKTTPPHVKAARKLDKLEGNIIKYYITTQGPEPIEKLQHPIDYDHYIEKQIKPIADSILTFFDTNIDDLLKGTTQKDLFSF